MGYGGTVPVARRSIFNKVCHVASRHVSRNQLHYHDTTMEPKKPRKNAKPINPVTGITDGKLRTLIKGSLRPIWRDTSRRVFIASIRRQERNPATGKIRFVIDCADCYRTMGISEKEFRKLKSGKKRAKASLVYEIDHVAGITPLAGIQDTLGDYVHSLLFGAQQAVCHACHAERTAAQTAKRNK